MQEALWLYLFSHCVQLLEVVATVKEMKQVKCLVLKTAMIVN